MRVFNLIQTCTIRIVFVGRKKKFRFKINGKIDVCMRMDIGKAFVPIIDNISIAQEIFKCNKSQVNNLLLLCVCVREFKYINVSMEASLCLSQSLTLPAYVYLNVNESIIPKNWANTNENES